MPKLLLTKRNIDSVKHIPSVKSGHVDYFDTEIKGLLLKVGTDSKTFYCKADVKDETTGKFKTVKEKIGRYGEYTPEEVRALAPAIIRRLREGTVKPEKAKTLRDMYERYIIDKRLAMGTLTLYRSYIPRMFESWLDIPLDLLEKALAPEIVVDRFNTIREVSGAGAANNSFKCLQAIIGYAELLFPQHITRNPIKILSRTSSWVNMGSRDDHLDVKQFKPFAEALLTRTPAHRDCYLFALYHGIRPAEAYTLQWANVDMEKGVVSFKHETEISKRSYTVPLSAQSREILERRKTLAEEGYAYVFPAQGARNTHKHLMLRSDELKRITGLDLSVHGLRRSFITTGERLRLRREDINKLTGHVDSSITGKHYSKTTPDDLRPVLQAICNELERLMIHGVAKVIDINTARQAA